jgi:hypothetical protein
MMKYRDIEYVNNGLMDCNVVWCAGVHVVEYVNIEMNGFRVREYRNELI